ncbi:MAG: hypothetical protein QXY90_06170 [Candidatus Anstonellales archaeon]
MEYQKILSRPEARHRYWHISKADRGFFPDGNISFKLKFDGKIYNMKVNHKDDIMTGQIYERYRFQEGDRIIVKKIDKDIYALEAPDTELYPTTIEKT